MCVYISRNVHLSAWQSIRPSWRTQTTEDNAGAYSHMAGTDLPVPDHTRQPEYERREKFIHFEHFIRIAEIYRDRATLGTLAAVPSTNDTRPATERNRRGVHLDHQSRYRDDIGFRTGISDDIRRVGKLPTIRAHKSGNALPYVCAARSYVVVEQMAASDAGGAIRGARSSISSIFGSGANSTSLRPRLAAIPWAVALRCQESVVDLHIPIPRLISGGLT